MDDLKFSCPQCQQHIECDPGYAGLEIACPACNNNLVVPGEAVSAPAVAPGVACPGCGTSLTPEAKLCTECGYDLVTGQRLQMQTQSAPPPRPGAFPPAPAPTRKKPLASEGLNPNIVAGVIVLVLGVLYALARSNPEMALVYVAVQGIYSLVIAVMVLIKAFQESTGTGFMTLCIPCYILYFVYGLSESPMLKALFSVSLLSQVGSATLKDAIETGK